MNEMPESINDELEKRKKLVEELWNKGIEDEEVKEMLQKWTIEQEEKVERAGATLGARVNFELERAKVYRDAGYLDDALDTLYDTLDMVEQENNRELEEKIRGEIETINNIDEN